MAILKSLYPKNLSLLHGLVHLFYPRLCEGCSKPLLATEEVLCISCALQFPDTNYHHIADNDTAIRFAGRIPYTHATSLAYFTQDGLLQHLLHGLKYRGKKEIGYYLGRRLANSIRTSGFGTEWLSSVDAIIPVPLYKTRKASRGYNQSQLIATGMSEVLHIPVYDNFLQRVRETESQTHKSRTERVNNMAEAFRLEGTDKVSNKHVLLCDDVLTTGATLEACALALMKAEGVKISIVTIGIAV
jgi:ComF family protein